MRLTLRTLLSLKDGMLGAEVARDLAAKVEASDAARQLVARIEKVGARPTISAPAPDATGFAAAANSTAEYLDNVLPADRLAEFERVCFTSDAQLAETAATHEALAEWSRSPPAALDTAARQRLLAAVQARAAGGERSGIAYPTPIPADAALPRPTDDVARPKPPGSAPPPTSAWLLVAAAVVLLAALVGVLGWSLTKGGGRKAVPRQSAENRDVPAVPAGIAQPPARPPAVPVEAAPEPAPEAAAPAAGAVQAVAPAPELDAPVTAPPVVAASPPAPPPADDFPPFAEPAAEGAAAAEVSVVVTVPVPPIAAAVDQRVPQGAALAIAAPAAAAAPAAPPVAVAPPQPVATDPATGVAGRSVVLFRPQAGAEAWLAGVDRTPLAPPVDLVAPPFCRPTLVTDGLRITLEPGTRAMLTRDADGTPRLEVVFGAAVVAGAGRLGLTAGGLSGSVTADLAAPVGVEATLVRLPGATAASTRRIARILPVAGRLAWCPAEAADGGGEARPGGAGAAADIAAGQALVWRSDAPAAASVEAAGPPPAWLAGRSRDEAIDRRAADTLAQRLVGGAAAVPALDALAADRRQENRVAAASALALVGEFDALARLLVDDGRNALRGGLWARLDAVAVQPALARGPRAADALSRAVAAHAPPNAAESIVRFAHGFTDEELAAGAATELVDALESPHLVVRRYAIENLAEITDADGVDRLRYRADRPVESLREGAAWWRARLEQGRIRRAAEDAAADR